MSRTLPVSPPSPWRTAIVALALLGLLSGSACASQLLVPAIGTPDSAMAGATVASPRTPSAAAFSNPAGITALEPGAFAGSFGIPVGHSRLHTTIPPDYDTTSDFVAFAPDAGAVFSTDSSIRWGMALYGSLGSVFDSDADPAAGVVHDFFSAQSISNLALLAAIPIGERLSIGAAVSVVYGQSHLRYFQTVPFAFTVRGAGTQAIVGARYELTDRIALGLSFRTPGMLWASGDDGATGGTRQDVELDLDLPAQIFAGINAQITDRLGVGLSGRWTDSSTFSDSIFRLEDTPQANVPFIRSASDEWRIAAGLDFAAHQRLMLRGGLGYADAIVPDSWISPLLIDTAEWKFSAGFSWDLGEIGSFGRWTLDLTVGHSPTGARNVSASEAVIFPGRYTIGGQIYMIGLQTTL